MNRKFRALIFFTIISLVLFSSCKNSIEHNPKEKLVQVSGFVSTNGILEDSDVESDISRTALPDVSELVAGNQFYYKIIAEQEGSDTKTAYSPYPTYTIGLPLGTWKLSAYIYKGTSKDACVEANLLFEPDKTVEVTLEESDIYKPNTGNGLSTKIAQGTGSGTVNLKVAVESIYVADAVTATMDGKTQSKLFSGSILEQNIDFDGYEFASGSYLLNLTFFKDGQMVFVCSQWVNIINGLQTTKWVIDNNTPYFDGTGFSLTSTCIVYQNMTDFYVDPTADSSNDLGTPYNPFKTIDKAIARCTNPELDYTIKLCGNITGADSTVPISIDSTVKGKSLKICSSNSSVKRIVKVGPQTYVNHPCVSIVDCTLPITFSGLQFTGSQKTSSIDGVIYANKRDSITGDSHVILENCIIGSLDEISDFASFDSICANKATGVYCKNVKLTLEGCVIKNNKGSGIYMLGTKQPELEIKNTTITNNVSTNGAVHFNNMSLNLVSLTGSVQIFNNYTDTTASQQKNLFIEYNTNGSFTIDGSLDSDSKIGISISDAITLPAVFTNGYSTYVSGKSPDKIFFSDDSSKEITWNADNTEAVIKNKIPSESTVKNLELFENSYNAKDGTVGYDTYISSQTSEINFQNDVTEYNVDYYDTYSELNYNLRLKLPESFDSSKIFITGINSDNTQTNIEGTDGVNKSDSDETGYSYFTINHIKIMPSYEKIEIKFTGVSEKYVIIPVKSSTYYVRGGTDSILSEPPENFNLSGSKNFPFSELQTAIDILWNKTGTIVIDGVVENPQSQGGDYGYTTAQVSGDDTDITINSYSENPKNGTIKASSTPGDRVFAIWEGTVHLGENVTIKGGRCNDTCGGGIFNKGTLYLNGCIITDNEIIGGTYPLGGGIYGEKGSKIILQNGTKITSNTAYDGAGIAITGAQLIAEDCLIEDNIIKTNGHGSAIAVRSFKDSENPPEPVVGSLFELKNEAIIKDTIYLDDNQSDDDKNTLELIQLTSTISDDNEYKVQLAEYAAGILVIKSEGDAYSASYSKFKIYDALGTVSNYTVGSDGKLIYENNKDTGITVEEFVRKSVPVVSGIDKLVVERSGVNKIQIPVTNEVYGYLNGSTLTCILYNSRGEIVNKDGDNDYKVASLSYIDDKYYADYYINNLTAFAIGTYTLEISANSKTDGVDLETVSINLLVVY